MSPPSQQGKLQKATITKLDKSLKPVGQPFTCQFNPKSLSITKASAWTETTNKGHNAPPLDYGGAQAATMTVDLFFDTTDRPAADADVRKQGPQFLLELLKIDKSSGQPPICRFQWGKIKLFTAIVTNVNINYTMFLLDGTPIRADAKVTFKEWKDEGIFPPQNPTSRSEARKIRVVKEGETLDWIAYEEYGDPARWRHIAETNELMNPKDLRAGQILYLVPLP